MNIFEMPVGLKRVLPAVLNGCLGAHLRRLVFETDGQDIVEYALLTSFIGLAGAGAWNGIQTALGNMYVGMNNGIYGLWEPTDPVGGGS